jgi:hypothetical protein
MYQGRDWCAVDQAALFLLLLLLLLRLLLLRCDAACSGNAA